MKLKPMRAELRELDMLELTLDQLDKRLKSSAKRRDSERVIAIELEGRMKRRLADEIDRIIKASK